MSLYSIIYQHFIIKKRMKRTRLIALAIIIGSFITNELAAQELKLDSKSDKGFYIRAGAGYALGIGKTSGAPNELMPSYNQHSIDHTVHTTKFGSVTENTTDKSDKRTNAAFSLAEGLNGRLDVGYMFSKYFGVELGFSYFNGNNNEVVNSTDYKSIKTTITSKSTNSITNTKSKETKYSMKRTAFAITPAIKLVLPISNHISVYSRLGVYLPFKNDMEYQINSHEYTYYNSTTSNIKNGSNNNVYKKEKFESYFNAGYDASLGLNYNFNNHFGIFGEINMIAISYEVKKSTITNWTTTTDGKETDKMTGLKTNEIVTEYNKSYDINSTSSSDSPKQDVSFSLPSSSIGINIGIVFKF